MSWNYKKDIIFIAYWARITIPENIKTSKNTLTLTRFLVQYFLTKFLYLLKNKLVIRIIPQSFAKPGSIFIKYLRKISRIISAHWRPINKNENVKTYDCNIWKFCIVWLLFEKKRVAKIKQIPNRINIPDKAIDYNLFFSVRNGVEFPHSNLYFKYYLKDSTGILLESELIDFQLFHPKSGYPLGNGIGDMFEHRYEILTKYQFDKAGSYELSFQQYMRYDSLPQIFSVGYRVEKTINQ